MATPRDTSVETNFPFSSTVRNYSRIQNGWNGDKRTVYPYKGHTVFSRGYQTNIVNNNKVAIDAPNTTSLSTFGNGIPSWSQAAYNQAYARFREKAVGEQAELGVMFAEWKEALNLIGGSIVGITEAYRAARKGNFKKAATFMGILDPGQTARLAKNRRTWRTGSARSAANAWLGYAFGISPMVADIQSAIQVLSQDIPFGFAKGSATARRNVRIESPSGGPIYTQEAILTHRIQGKVFMTNYNLFLANQLGLLNPLSLVWELIPFSFMVDWFFKVGNYLSSFTDWVGVELRDPCVSHFIRFRDSARWVQSFMTPETQYAFGLALVRETSIPRPIPVFSVNGNLGTSLTRAASAVSILVNLLTSSYQRDVG